MKEKSWWILTLALNLSQFIRWSYCDGLTFDWFYWRFPYAATERQPRILIGNDELINMIR